jgi:hypothetical protein
MRRLIPFFAAIILTAHPMGNFSVSHFTRFDVQKKSVTVTYVLDLAEIPTYQLMRDWNLDPSADAKIPQETLDAKAAGQAKEWIKQLDFSSGSPTLEKTTIKLSPGAGHAGSPRGDSSAPRQPPRQTKLRRPQLPRPRRLERNRYHVH